MTGFKRLMVISSVVLIALGVALALVTIVGIWSGFEEPWFGKTIATLTVLFFLSAFLHLVAKGICEEPKKKN